MLAGGNILSAGTNDFISTTGANSHITLVAGVVPSVTGSPITPQTAATTTVIDFSSLSNTGGNIDLTASTRSGALIQTSGAHVTLAAFSSTAGTGGNIFLNNGANQNSINTGLGGNVTLIAGADPTTAQPTINVRDISTQGGSVAIYTQQPDSSLANHTVTFNGLGVNTLGSVEPSGPFSNNGQVVVGNVRTASQGSNSSSPTFPLTGPNGRSAGNIEIHAGSAISASSLLAFGNGGNGGGAYLEYRGSIAGAGGNGGNGGSIFLGGNGVDRTGSISVTGDVNSSGGGGGGGGGGLGTTAPGGSGGTAGPITFAANGSVTVAGNIRAADGGSGGAGSSNSGGGGGGGSFGGGGGGGGSIGNGGGANGGGGASGGGGGAWAIGNSFYVGFSMGGGGGGFSGGGGGLYQNNSGSVGQNGQSGGSPNGGIGGNPGSFTPSGLGIGGTGGGQTYLGPLAPSGRNVPGFSGESASLTQNNDISITGTGISLSQPIQSVRNLSLIAPTLSGGSISQTINITTNNTVTLAADGAGIVTQALGLSVSSPNLVLRSGSGNIGAATGTTQNISTNASTITASTGTSGSTGSVFINDTSSTGVLLIGSNTAGSTGSFLLTATNGISTGGVITSIAGGTVGLTSSSGSISLNHNLTGTTSVALQVSSSENILQSSTATIFTPALDLSSGSGYIGAGIGSELKFTNGVNPVALTFDSVSGNAFLKSNGAGVINLGSTTGTVGSTFSIDSPGGITTTSDLSTLPSGSLTFVTDAFTNSNDIAATGGSINITSQSGSGLTISGPSSPGPAGTMTAIVINLDAVASNLTLNGLQTFTGTTNLFADAVGQSIVVTNEALFSGTNTVNLNTCSLVLQGTGTITGNPLVLNCPTGVGTIANSTGNVNIATDLIFNGSNLAILAANDVTFSGAGTDLIDLSSALGGGSVIIMAGYDFTPATPGQVGPNGTIYTITAENMVGGSINLGGINILTNASAGAGGNVTLIANGGTLLGSGAIAIGAINASGSTIGGNISMIGEGDITANGIIQSSGSAIVDLAVAQPTRIGTVTVGGGKLLSGSFEVGSSTAGDIALSGINNAASSITIRGANTALNTVTSSSSINANTLNLVGLNGSFNFTSSAVATLNASSNNSVTLANNTGNILLGSITGISPDLSVTSSGSINTTTAISVDQLSLTGSSVTLSHGVVSSGASSLTATSGAVTITNTGSLTGAGNKTLTAQIGGTDIVVNGALTSSANGLLLTTNNGDIVLNNTVAGITGVALNSSGTINQSALASVNGGALTVSFASGAVTLATVVTSLTTTGGTSLTINEADGLTLNNQGTLNSLSVNAGLTAAGNITINNNIVLPGNLSLDSNSGAIAIGAFNIGAASLVSLDAAGSITQGTGSTIFATSLSVAFGAGPVTLATNVASLTTQATGNFLTINEADGINLLSQNLNILTINAGTTSAGNLTTGADIVLAGNLILNNNNGDTTVTNDLGGASVTLDASGIITIASSGSVSANNTATLTSNGDQSISGIVAGNNISATSTNGAMTVAATGGLNATNNTTLRSATAMTINGLVVAGNNLSATSTGSTLTVGSTASVDGTNQTTLQSSGTLTSNGDVSGDMTSLRSTAADVAISDGTVIGTTSASVRGNTNITTSNSGDVVGQTVTLTADTGNISGTSGFAVDSTNLTANSGGFVNVAESSGVALSGASSAGSSFTLNAGGALSTTIAGTITAGSVDLDGTTANLQGSITSTGGVTVDTSAGSLLTGAAATISGSSIGLSAVGGGISLGANVSGTTSIGLTVSGANNISQGFAATLITQSLNINSGTGTVGTSGFEIKFTNGSSPVALTLTKSGGSSAFASQGAGAVNVGSTGANVIGSDFALNANGNVAIATDLNTTASGSMSFFTDDFTNVNDLTSSGGTINVTSHAGSGLNIHGSTGVAPAGTMTANNINIDAVDNNLTFTGKQTFTGTANLYADDEDQSLVITNGTTVIGNNTVNVYSCDLVLQGTGTITGNPLNIICGDSNGAGTIANNTGDVNLASVGSFNFFGQSLAIIATGNVTNSGGAINIQLNNTGTGDGGSLTVLAGYDFDPDTGNVQINPPNNTVYTNFSDSTSGGDILLSNVSVNTGAASGNGGNILMVANGNVAAGQLVIGAISANGTSNGGAVTLIAEGGITTGLIQTSGTASVNLASASANATAGTTIDNGELTSGGFTVNTATNAGISSSVNASTLNLTGGTGTLSISNSQVATLNATSTGSVNLLNNAGNIQLGNIVGSVLDLSVTATGSIATTSGFTTDSLVLSGSSVTVNHAVVANNTSSLTASVGNVLIANTGSFTGAGTKNLTTQLGAGHIIVVGGLSSAADLSLTSNSGNIFLNNTITGSGNISLDSSGTISQSGGSSIIGGALNVKFGSGLVTLATNVSSIATSGSLGQTLTINESNGISIGNQAISSLIVNTTNGSILVPVATPLTVAGTLSLNAGGATNDVTVSAGSNISAGTIIFQAADDIDLASSVTGTTSIGLYAGDTISQSGGTLIGGALALGFATGGFTLSTDVLSLTTNSSVTNQALTISEATGISVLGQTNISSLIVNTTNGSITLDADYAGATLLTLSAGGAGSIALNSNMSATTAINLTAAGTITQAATKTIGGGTLNILGFGSGPVTLATNVANLGVTAAGQSLTINEGNGVNLSASTADSLTVNAATGNIGSTGPVNTSVLSLNTTAGNIALNSTVTGTTSVTLNSSGSISNSGDVNGGALNLIWNTGNTVLSTNVNSVTASGNNNSLNITDGNSITILGQTAINNLAVTANGGGDINTGAVVSVGSVFFNAANDINVNNTLTAAPGSMTLLAGGDVNLNVGITGATTVSITAGDTISQTGGSVNSNGGLTLSFNNGPVTLATNVATITATGTGSNDSLTINEANGIAVNTMTTLDNVTINAGLSGNGDITTIAPIQVNNALVVNNAFAGTGDVILSNNLTATSVTLGTNGGGISQSNTAVINANVLNINLNNAGTADLNDANNIVNTLNTNVVGAGLTQLLVAPNTNLAINNILGSATQDLEVTMQGTGSISTSGPAFSVDQLTVNTSSGSITINTNVTTTGNTLLSINNPAAPATADITIAGTGSLVGSGDKTLDNNGLGDVIVNGAVSGDDTSISTSAIGSTIALGAGVTGTSTIALTSGGTISGAGVVGGGALTLSYATGNPNLNTNVASLTTTSGVGTLTINEANGISLGSQTGINSLAVNAAQSSAGNISTTSNILLGGAFALSTNTAFGGNINLNNNVGSSGAGSVTLSANGTINQAGGTTVQGGLLDVHFTSGPVTLATSVTALTTTASAGQSLTINEASGIQVNAQSLTNLTVNAGLSAAGNITTGANVTVSGNLTLDNNSGDIVLSNGLSANNLVLDASNAINLGTQLVNGTTTVSLVAPNGITQTAGGSVTGGALSLTFGNGPVTLASSVVSLTTNAAGQDLTINETNGIQLLGQSLSALTVNAGLTGSGNITTGANITVANNLTLDNNNGDIILTNNVSGDTLVLDASGILSLGNGIVNGTTTANLTGNTITQGVGGVVTGGALTVAFASGPVTLATNVTSLSASAAGQTLNINEVNGISLLAQTLGSLNVTTTNGSITVDAPFSVTNALSLNAQGGGSVVDINSAIAGTTVQLSAADNVSLDGNVTGSTSVTITAGNTITQTGGTSVNGGALSLTWTNSAVTLATDVASLTSNSAGNTLTINEDDGIVLNSQNVANLNVNAGIGSNGNIVTAANISLSGNLNLDVNNGGNIVINNNVGGNNVSLDANGTITQAAFTQITATNLLTIAFVNGPVSLNTQTGSLTTLSGTTLTINEVDGINLLAQGVNTLNVNAGLTGAGNITTGAAITVAGALNLHDFNGNVIINNNVNAADLTLNASNNVVLNNFLVTGTSTVNLIAGNTITQTAGGSVAGGALSVTFGVGPVTLATAVASMTANSAGNTLTINEADGINLGLQSLNTLTVNAGLIATGTLATTADFTVNNLNLNTSNGSDIALNSNVIGTTAVALNSAATITQTGGTTLGGGALSLTYVTGPVTLAIAVNSMTSSAPGTTLTINENDGINLGSQNVINLTVNAGLVANGNLTTSTSIVLAGNLTLDNNNGNINLNNNIAGAAVSLDAQGTITQAALTNISGTSLSVTFGSGPVVLATNVGSLTTNAGGQTLTINEANGIDLGAQVLSSLTINAGLATIGDISTTSGFTVTTLSLNTFNGGDININNAVVGTSTTLNSSDDINLAADLIGSTTLALTAADTITRTGGTLIGTALTLNYATGAPTLSTSVDTVTTNAAGTTLTLNETNGITILGQNLASLTVNAALGDITTGVNLNIATIAFNTTVGDINLNHNLNSGTSTSLTVGGAGSISQGAAVTINTPTLFLSAVNGDTGSGAANLKFTNGTNNVALTVTGGAGDAFLTSQGTGTVLLGAVGPGFAIGNDFSLNATGTIQTTSNVTATGLVTLTTEQLTNANNITGQAVTIASHLGNGLTIAGGAGGTLTATNGDINITANATLATHSLVFTGTTNFDNVTAGTVTNLDADAVFGQQLVISTVANVSGNRTVNAFTCNLILQGSLTGNPLNLICPTGVGTIANSTGDVDLALVGGGFNFIGQDLAIIASGSVLNSLGGTTTINLSDPAGSGGDLLVLAGYDFTPATPGQVGPNGTVYAITGANTTGGNIDLGNTNVTTTGTGAGNFGGNVLLIANGGSTNFGTIDIGSVDATGTANGGTVTMISEGGITSGLVSTNGTATVNLAAASANMAANTQVGNGKILVGGFSIGTVTNANVTASVNATTLNLTGDTGAFNITASQVDTLNANSTGSVTLANNTGAIAIGSIAGATALDLSVTATGAITTTSAFTADNLDLSGSTVTLSNNITANNTSTLTVTAGNVTITNTGSFIGAGDKTLVSTGAGNVVVGGILSGDDLVLTANNGNLQLNANITGVTSTTLTSSTNITQLAGTKVTTGTLALNFFAGPVTLATNADSLSVNAVGTNLTINEDNALTIAGSNASTLIVNAGLVATGDINTTGAITGTAIALNANNGGDININVGGTINAVNSLLLNAGDDIVLNDNVTGNVTLTATAADTISGGTGSLNGGALTLNFANGPVTVSTNVASLTSSAAGQSLTINEANGIVLNSQNLGALAVNAGLTGAGTLSTNADIVLTGNLTLDNNSGNIALNNNVGGLNITLDASGTITQTGGSKISGTNLSIAFGSGPVALATNVSTLTTNAAGQSLVINEDNAIQLLGQTASGLTINAGQSGIGNILASVDLTVTTLALNANTAGDITLNANVGGTTSVALNAGDTIFQLGGTTVSGGALSLTFANGPINLATNVTSLTTSGNSQSLVIDEANDINLLAQTLGSLTVNTTAGSINVNAPLSVSALVLNAGGATSDINLANGVTGTTSVSLTAGDTIAGTGTVAGGALTLAYVNGPVTLNTAVNSLTTNAAGTTLTINENDGIQLLAQNVGTLTANAGIFGGGNILLSNNVVLTGDLTLNNDQGSIILNGNVGGNNVVIDSFGTVTQSALRTISGNALTLAFGSSPVTLNTAVGSLTTSALGGLLTINEADGIDLGAQTLTSLTVNAAQTGAGSINTTANFSVTTLALSTAVGGDINLNSNVGGSSTVAINSAGTITQGGTNNLSGGAGTLTWTTGSVNLRTALNSLTSTGGANTLTINESDGISLLAQNVSALTVNAGLTGAGDITTASNIVLAGALVLDNNNGSIALNNNVGGSNVTLDASGAIVQAVLQQITSAGTLSVAFGNGPVTLSTSVASLTTNAGANALTINEASAITLLGQTIGSLTVNAGLTATGDITASNAFSVTNLTLNAGNGGDINLNANVAGTNTIVLNAGDTIVQLGGTTLGGGAASLTWVNGAVSLATNVASLTANAAGQSLTITETNGINFGTLTQSDLNVTAGGSIALNNGTTLNTLTLVSNGGAIDLNSNTQATTAALTVNGGSGAITIAGTGSLTGAGTKILVNTGSGAINVNGALQGTTLALTSGAGSIGINAATTATSTVGLTTNGGSISQNATGVITAPSGLTVALNGGGSAALNLANNSVSTINGIGSGSISLNNGNTNIVIGTLGSTQSLTTLTTGTTSTTGNITTSGNVDVTTRTFLFDDILTANQIDVRSAAGGGLTINSNSGAAVYTAAISTNFDAVTNDLTLTNGTMTFNGLANLTADTATQNLIVAANAIVNGNAQVNVNSCHVTLSGILTGNPLVYNCPFGIGTIANNFGTGDVNLSGDIIFAGANFAILAKGSINTTGLTTINLSNPTGDGGNLLLLAGFDFSPNTPGQVQDSQPYTIGSANAQGGNINLGSVAINLSSGNGDGGTLQAIANGGVLAGTVALGTITTSASANAGNVTVIGEGGITIGAINTTGGITNGNASLAVAQPIIVGGTITVTDGVQSGPGAFVASTASAGNISFSTINTGTGSVSLTGGLGVANTITQTGGVVIANTLNLNIGAGVANIVNSTINSLNTSATGAADISVTNSQALALGTITGVSQDLTVVANGAITNTSNFAVDELSLQGTAVAGNAAINLTGIVTATTSASLTNTGAGNILGSISTANLSLTSNGNIGVDTSNRFTSNAGIVSANASNGSVFFRSTAAGGVTVGASSASTGGGVFNLLSDNNVTTNIGGTIAASNVVLTSTNGGFSLADSVTGTTSVAFTAAANILNTNFGGGIITNNLTLNSTGGSVGTSNVSRFNTNVAFLSANAAASVFINNTNAGGVQIAGPSSAVDTFDIVAVNNISSTIAGDIDADVVNLTAGVGGFNLAGTVTGTSSVSLTAATNINNTGFGGGIVTDNLSVTSTNGNIGSASNRFFTSVANLSANATAGNVFLSDGGLGINLTNSTASGVFDIVATNDITGGTITAGSVSLVSNAGNLGVDDANRLTINTQTITLLNALAGDVFVNNTNAGATTLVAGDAAGIFDIRSAGNLTSAASFDAPTLAFRAGGNLNLTGALTAGLQLTLETAGDLTAAQVSGTITTPLLSLISTNGNVGTGSATPFNLAANIETVQATAMNGNVYLNSLSTDGVTFLNSTAGTDMLLSADGPLTVAGTITTLNGDLNVIADRGALNIAADATVTANEGNLTFQVLDTTKSARKTSKIIFGADSSALALASAKSATAGNLFLTLGAVAPAPVPGKAPRKNVTVNNQNGTIFWGKRGITAVGPTNTVNAINSTITINNPLNRKNISLGGGVTLTADPPLAPADEALTEVLTNVAVATGNSALTASANNSGASQSSKESNSARFTAPSPMGVENIAIDALNLATVDNGLTTTDAFTNAATIFGANGNGTVSKAGKNTIATATQTENRIPLNGGIEDNSYMVSAEGPTTETEATICSDAELGVDAGNVARTAHSDKVVLRKGNVLFVPFRDTVVETPQGNITIAAKSVALVSVSEGKLSVYDIEDAHKGSVAITAHGRTTTLAPGRHLTVANAKAGEFAQVNSIESIPHRGLVSKSLDNGIKMHISEFSTASAIQTIKPLKAVMSSTHPQAKKVSDRLIKTTAVILSMTSGKADFQHYFKPALTAMAQ